MNADNREMRIAYLLVAKDDLLRERKAWMDEWKTRYTQLDNEFRSICNAIILGQNPLPLEPADPEKVDA